ncbi:hypothetical protein QFC24_004147 [Naganishia onofrii]|uniref:Uncharacterized protein n=1 Tax=Naganishia onofrii TaxID=1851511 RepID=A0ACC2XGF9_9TREE|nr:hypothetical protein QFC24_004147 [Naganishia onofrii]
MAQTHSKTDTLAHIGNSLDQRTSPQEPRDTATQKNSSPLDHKSDKDDLPTPPISLAKSNEPRSYNGNASSGKRIDDDLDREDQEMVARKAEAKAQSHKDTGRDTTF